MLLFFFTSAKEPVFFCMVYLLVCLDHKAMDTIIKRSMLCCKMQEVVQYRKNKGIHVQYRLLRHRGKLPPKITQ